jgi:lipid-A-disaccharide synthase
LAFMGFAEVVKNLPTILNNIKFCKQDILSFQPDVLVLIDYPGFNLRIAKWAKQKGIKVVYYIAPQVWAWKAGRTKSMKTCIDQLICILPFEKDYFKSKWDWDVEYVGNPLAEEIEEYTKSAVAKDVAGEKIIALLPGSRKQEIAKKLPVMLDVSKQFPEYTFVVAKAPGQDDSFYEPFLLPYKNVRSVRNETYKLLLKSTAALVTSGTATLETALFSVPEVVCYKGSNISYQIAKRLVKVKYISLVNLIMDKPVITELIQNDMNTKNVTKELNALLNDPLRQQQLQKDYAALKNILSVNGNASANAAKIVVTAAAH